MLHGLFLDLRSFVEDLLRSAEVHICGGQVIQGLMVPLVVVILHKTGDLGFEFTWKEIVLQVHNVLHRAMITLDLALGHGVVRSSSCMLDVFAFQEELEILGKITGAIIGQQTRTMLHQNMVETGLVQCQKQRVLHIAGVHRRGEFPGQDIT